MKFYRCEHCGNLMILLESSGVPVMCCGQEMKQLVPGSVDAALEKHVPVLSRRGDLIAAQVGAAEHPMLPEHHIPWIALDSGHGCQIKYLEPGRRPEAVFALAPGERTEQVYAYCNLHGLWQTQTPSV